MGQLTWQNIQTDFSGGAGDRRVSSSLGGFDMVNEALSEIEAAQKGKVAAQEIQKGMSIGDPEVFQEAMRKGYFKITPENYEFFKGRVGELLGEEKTRQDMTLAQQQEARAKQTQAAELKSRGLTDTGQGILNEQNQFNLNKSVRELELAESRLAANPVAMERVAALRALVLDGKLEGAQKLLQHPDTVRVMAEAGWDDEKQQQILTNFNGIATNLRTQEKERYTTQQEKKLRPGEEQISVLKQAKEGQGLETELKAGERAGEVTRRGIETEDIAYNNQQKALEVFKELRDGQYGGSLNSLHEGLRNYKDLDPAVYALVDQAIQTAAGAYADRTPQQVIDEMYTNQPNAPRGQRYVGEGYTPAAGSLVGLIDQREGAGDYSTLFGHAQKPGGAFEGFDVTKMTIGELDRFANSGYKSWVAGQNNGTAASPMGRYQIVNDTLQSAAQTLGLSPDTVFNKETQDQIFKFLVNQRLGSRGGLQGQIEGLRNEWAGLKDVDDATLAKAIQDFQSGSLTGLEGATELSATPTAEATVPLDETSGVQAAQTLDSFIKRKEPLGPQELNIVNEQAKIFTEEAAIVSDALTAADMFGGQSKALLAAMQDPAVNRKSVADVDTELKTKFGEIQGGQLTDEINWAVDNLGMPPGVAQAFIENAPVETYWVNPFRPDRHIDRDKIRTLFSDFYDVETKDPAKRIRGALEEMQSIRQKTQGADNLKAYQAEVASAMIEVANIADRKKTNPNIDDKKPLRKLQIAEQRLRAEMEKLDAAASSQLTKQIENQ